MKFRLFSFLFTLFLLPSVVYAEGTKPVLIEKCPDVGFDVLAPNSDLHSSVVEKSLRENRAPKIVYALGKDRRSALKELLGSGENPNTCALGSSILNISVVSGDLEEVQILLDGGAYPDQPYDSSGGTPLMSALGFAHYDIALFLLKHGANSRQATDGGTTTLHELANTVIKPDSKESLMQLEVARRLIQLGASVNAQVPISKGTPLMFAILQDNKPLVSLLIEKGADVNLMNAKGETALTYAQKKGNAEIIKILEEAEKQQSLKKAA